MYFLAISPQQLLNDYSVNIIERKPIWFSKQNWQVYQQLIRLREVIFLFSSVQFSRSVVSDTLRPQEWQHARPPCPSPTPGVHWDLPPSSQWCHTAISSSVVPFSSCPQSFPASESFPMSQLFAWGGQSTGVSALASVLPKNTQGWSPSEWTGWISLQSKVIFKLSNFSWVENTKSNLLLHDLF